MAVRRPRGAQTTTVRSARATHLVLCSALLGCLLHGASSRAELPEPSADDFRLDAEVPEKESEAEIASYAELFSGQAVYSIPLDLPQGTAGAQPELALTYRSGRRSGYAGAGWSLDIPAIVRTRKHGAFAAYRAPNEEAIYELDGESLIRGGRVQGPTPAGCPGVTIAYLREISRFERVYYCQPEDYFVVATPDGMLRRYGTTPTAKHVTAEGRTLAYHLSETVNRNGLAWRVSYWGYGNCSRDPNLDLSTPATASSGLCGPLPRSISYAYKNDVPVGARRQVDLLWQDEPRPTDLDLTFLSYRRARLARIDIKVGGGIVRHYDLSYRPSSHTGASLLDAVTVYGGSTLANRWRRFAFDYADHGYGFTSEPVTPGGRVTGFLDPVSYYHGYSARNYVQNHKALGFRMMVTSASPISSPLAGQQGMGPITIGPADSFEVPEVYGLTDTSQDLIDIDGDGLRDLLQVHWSNSCGNGGCYRWYVRHAVAPLEFSPQRSVVQGIRDVFLRRTVTRHFGGEQPRREPKLLYEMVDVDGNGLLDLFTRDGVFLNVGGRFELREWDWNDQGGAPLFVSADRYKEGGEYRTASNLVDVDGDGCVDHLYTASQAGAHTDGLLTGPVTSTGPIRVWWTAQTGHQRKAYLYESREGVSGHRKRDVTGLHQWTSEEHAPGRYTYRLQLCFRETEHEAGGGPGQELCDPTSPGVTVDVTGGWMVRRNRMCDPVPVMGFEAARAFESPGKPLPQYVGRTYAYSTSSLTDINGDGLVDFVWDEALGDGKTEVLLGTGAGFMAEVAFGTDYGADLRALTGSAIFEQQKNVPQSKDEFPACFDSPRNESPQTPQGQHPCGSGGQNVVFDFWRRAMLSVADFNGDGRPDVLLKKGYKERARTSYRSLTPPPGPGDAPGPGVGSDDPAGPLEVYANTGVGFVETPSTIVRPSSGLIQGHFFVAQADESQPGDPTYTTATVLRTGPVGKSQSAELLVMSYLNNYGAAPQLARYANTTPTRPDLLTRVDNGWGTTVDLRYGVYVQGLDGEGAEPTLPFRRLVLESVKVRDEPSSDGTRCETAYETRYRYANGYFDEEFKGFGKVSAVFSDGSGLTEARQEEHSFHLGAGRRICAAESGFCFSDQPALVGRTYLLVVSKPGDPAPGEARTWSETWALRDTQSFTFGGQSAKAPVLLRRIEYDRERLSSSEKKRQRMTRYEHDGFGNVVMEQHFGWFAGNAASLDSDAGDGSYTVASTFAVPVAHGYLVDLPSAVETYQGAGGTRETLRRKEMKYDDLPLGEVSAGNLTEITESVISSTGQTDTVVTVYGRDPYGNPTSFSVDGDLIGTFEYQAPEHIHVSRKTARVAKGKPAPLMLETRFWWDDSLGVLLDELGPAGRWLSHRYDVHGREVALWSCPPERACTSKDEATVLLVEKHYDEHAIPRRVVTRRYFTRARTGSCDAGCGAYSACVAGECACTQGHGNCNGSWSDGCESQLTSPDHCGACGRSCSGSLEGEACVKTVSRAPQVSWSCGCASNSDCRSGYECSQWRCRPAR